MKLKDWHEQQYPTHSRTSCSDDNPINADVDGSGCHRCNAILFEQHDELKKDADHWRIECSEAREMYYDAIKQRDQLRDQLAAAQAREAELLAVLAEATEFVDRHSEPWYLSGQSLLKRCRAALASTPEQSLTEYRNKVIEAFVNEFSRHVGGDGEFWLHELQDFAMKEQP